MLVLTAPLAPAQESATQQQIDKLSGQIQDLLETQAQQGKRLDAIDREINELREKVNSPVVNESASNADLKKLAQQVQEIERKRADDHETVVAQLDKLGKAVATAPVTPLPKPRTSTPKPAVDDTSAPAVPQKGYEYEVKQGDTLGLIVKAYRDQGVKVTKTQIIKANPKINPDVLIPGKKIFIPDASAK